MKTRMRMYGLCLFAALAAISTTAVSAAKSTGTTLKITNNTAQAVPVQITLGSTKSAANNFGISSISQLPAAWGIVPEKSAPTTQGIFILAGGTSVSFNSGTKSFSGNVAFGPKFSGRGCGDSSVGACYPNSINLGEFTLNIAGGAETVDISNVNGANAYIALKFSGQSKANRWNDGSFKGANGNVLKIANKQLTSPVTQPGVFGWQATNCINVVQPIPNPTATCPAPINGPGSAQLQTNPQCNIQRGTGAPTGGTVEVVFSGYLPNSAPGASCIAPNVIAPVSGTQAGGTQVTLTGWGFSAVTGVTLQGVAATSVVATNQTLTFVTPACSFCTPTAPQPWNSNVILTLSNGTTYTLPADVAGANAAAAFTYTSP
jgi:IPT/TIG domain